MRHFIALSALILSFFLVCAPLTTFAQSGPSSSTTTTTQGSGSSASGSQGNSSDSSASNASSDASKSSPTTETTTTTTTTIPWAWIVGGVVLVIAIFGIMSMNNRSTSTTTRIER